MMIGKRLRIGSSWAKLWLVASVLLVAVLGISPAVSARESSDSRDVSEQSQSTTVTNLEDQDSDSQRSGNSRQQSKKTTDNKANKGRSGVSHEKFKLRCLNNQKAINNKISAFSGAANRHLARLNTLLDKIVALKEEPALEVTGYDTLLADARTKQVAAVTTVNNLKAVATNINCDDPTTVVKLKDVKVAAAATRQALQVYRQAVIQLLDAVLDVANTANNAPSGQSTGGVQ